MAMFATMMAALMLIQEAAAPGPPASPPSSPCSAEEYPGFDFWLGEWEVTPNGSETQIATSRIEKVSSGCAIAETWMPLNGGGGSSLTARDPQTGVWHQLWIGSAPGRVFFEGGPVGGTMVLTGYWGNEANGEPQLIRMTYSLREDGTVRQYGEASSDHGASWSDSFDFIYSPKSG